LDILKAYLKYDESSILIWAGTGELLDSVKSYAEQIGVSDHVIFLGDRADVNKLYSAMDVFLLPSRFEGLGMVYVEAQCSGLYCFASSTVPRDTAITPNIQYINLSKSAEEWAQKIAQSKEYYFQRGDYSKIISDNGYDLRKEKGRMAEIYDMALANRR
jgi:glycosyltransferase involved in cell wall biosynthesis